MLSVEQQNLSQDMERDGQDPQAFRWETHAPAGTTSPDDILTMIAGETQLSCSRT